MKHIIRRLAASGLEVKARMKIGCDCVDVVDDGSHRILLNGYDTVSCGDSVDDAAVAEFLADMLGKMIKSGRGKAVVMLGGGSDGIMRQVSGLLNKSLGKGTAALQKLQDDDLAVAPADHKVEQTINPEAVARNAEILASKVSKLAASIGDGYDAALMMTRKKIVASMWGADKIQAVLDRTKARLEDRTLPWSRVAVSVNMLAKSADRLCRKIGSKESGDRGLVANVLIPSITDGYVTLKAASESAAVSFQPLVHIDSICKTNTTYPSTWFFDQDIIDRIAGSYDSVLGFLMQVPTMEAKVVDPLSSVRMHIMDTVR